MRCTSPRTVGFKSDGKTISWSQKDYSKEYATFQLPCGKCIDCRLAYAREWAVRCVHESRVHVSNCFITLTYNDENLTSDKLYYADFQLFMKRLRDKNFRELKKTIGKENWKLLSKSERKKIYDEHAIGVFVTGEYGEINKRPHWHAILFNWEPTDKMYSHTTDRGDKCYTSRTLDELWGKGSTLLGAVTIESAGYCARYAAKKLVHGKDEDHDYHPISKKSSKHAIGKKFLEKFWPDIFNYGKCEIKSSDGTIVNHPIPRYYEKWFQKTHPERWNDYVTGRKSEKIAAANKKATMANAEYIKNVERTGRFEITQLEQKRKITKSKFKQLQERLKL